MKQQVFRLTFATERIKNSDIIIDFTLRGHTQLSQDKCTQYEI